MSRSYAKKHRICNQHTDAKRKANKRVRKTDELASGNAYKKVYSSREINDGGRAREIPKITPDSTAFEKEWTQKAKRK